VDYPTIVISNAGTITSNGVYPYDFPAAAESFSPEYYTDISIDNLRGAVMSGSGYGVYIGGGQDVRIDNGGVISGHYGAGISDGGVFSSFFLENSAGGTITGNSINSWGVHEWGKDGTVINSGTISGATGVNQNNYVSSTLVNLHGLILGTGTARDNPDGLGHNAAVVQSGAFFGISDISAEVINAATIAGRAGIEFRYMNERISNLPGGIIAGTAVGIYGQLGFVYHYRGIVAGPGSATITNAGTIVGGTGIALVGSTSVTSIIENSGLIDGTGGNAVKDVYSALLLEMTPSARFIGIVAAYGGLYNTLELQAGLDAGTITGIGTQFENFTTITIDTKAQWTLVGNASGLASGETITGFLHGDEIDLTGIAATSGSFAHGTLSLYGANHMLDAKLLLSEPASITSANFSLSSNNAGGVLINLVTPTSAAALVPTHTGL
jgi:hypothetical protein